MSHVLTTLYILVVVVSLLLPVDNISKNGQLFRRICKRFMYFVKKLSKYHL